MKKHLLLLFLAFAVLLSACGAAAPAASNKAVSLGKQAVGIIDAYLDGSKTAKTATSELKALREKMDYVHSYASGSALMTEEQRSDWSISSNLSYAISGINTDDYESTPEHYDSVIKTRNEIALLVGEPKR